MKIWHVVALVIGVLIAIQLTVLGIYLVLEDDTREYERDLTISIEWQEGNRTAKNYTVSVPLLVYSVSGEDVITSLDQIDIILGRGDLEIIDMEGASFLRITSDTAVTLRHSFRTSGEDVSPKEHEADLSSMGGDLEKGTASVLIDSDTDEVSVEIEYFQESLSGNHVRTITWATCNVDLNEGTSRYPLEKFVPDR